MNFNSESGFIEIDGFKLNYVIEGQGYPTLVVGSALYYPRTFSTDLRKHLKMIFIDHRGFADKISSSDSSRKNDLSAVIDDIEKIREKLNLKQFLIVGHSGHAFMALEYAKKYPQHVSHVALLAVSPDYGPENSKLTEQLFQDLADPARKEELEKSLKALPQELSQFPEKRFITFCLRLGARSWENYKFDATSLWKDVKVNMDIIDQLWGVDFRDIKITEGLEKFNKPVFIGLGYFDFLVPPYYTWNTVRSHFKNLKFCLFAKSSHTPQLEEPVLFDKELLNWLNSKST